MALQIDPETEGDLPTLQVPVTAEDMPIEVRRLLKSYRLNEVRWSVPADRHTVVVEILTRGEGVAEQWLWSQCSREDVRSLLSAFGGSGQDNEGREMLRQKMGLTEREIPNRPFAPVPWRG